MRGRHIKSARRILCAVLESFAMILMSAFPAASQTIEYGGYAEHQIFPQRMGGRTIVQDYSKVRLDLSVFLSDYLSIIGDGVAQIQHGKKDFNSLDFIPGSVVEDYGSWLGDSSQELRDRFAFRIKNEYYIDNAFISFSTDRASVRAGRQQLSWGPGYSWNPTDIFHDKNLMDPTYEKRGVDAVKAEIPFSEMGMITGVMGVGDGWTRAAKALKVSSHFSGFDVSVSVMETHETGYDFYAFSEAGERRRLVGADLSGGVGGIGVWFEGTYSQMEDSHDFAELLFGADYTTESGLYLISEYYRNGDGTQGRADYDINRWMNLLSASGENLARNYLFSGASWPLTDLLTGSAYTVINLDDGSAVAYPYFEYSASDNLVLTLIGYVTLGRSDAEFGAFGSGAILRGRLYF